MTLLCLDRGFEYVMLRSYLLDIGGILLYTVQNIEVLIPSYDSSLKRREVPGSTTVLRTVGTRISRSGEWC